MALTSLSLVAAGAPLRGSTIYNIVTENRILPARKTANEIVNNSATLQNDDALAVAGVANAAYTFDLRINYLSGTTPDLKIGWTFPTGLTMTWGGVYANTAGALTVIGNLVQTDTLAIGGSGAAAFASISGVAIFTTAGTLQLQWAQNTADASDTTIYSGSYLELRRIS